MAFTITSLFSAHLGYTRISIMPSRTRSKHRDWYIVKSFYGNSHPIILTYPSVVEAMEEIRKSFKLPGETAVRHAKAILRPYTVDTPYSQERGAVIWNCWDALSTAESLLELWRGQNNLNWSKLPTSSEHNIIMMLAEIDETIVGLAETLMGHISVGSYNYGLLPLWNDLVSILTSIKRVYEFTGEYEDSQGVSISTPVLPDSGGFTLTGKYKLSGHIEMPDIPINKILDWIGFHPDLATAWDLIPLSFLVNAVLPIGRFLQAFRQGGWVKAVYFQGFRSFKGTLSWALNEFSDPDTTGSIEAEVDLYFRQPFAGVLQVPPFNLNVERVPLDKAIERFITYFLRGVGR